MCRCCKGKDVEGGIDGPEYEDSDSATYSDEEVKRESLDPIFAGPGGRKITAATGPLKK